MTSRFDLTQELEQNLARWQHIGGAIGAVFLLLSIAALCAGLIFL